ncbi:growth arrest and DNA damage-inducible protein GADD45 beta-like [Lethenteron reissneri]|uniref:growth arrest and DNA damage-inducible protein GADD45 beta-like n=1 Tax=Lethenteron reissneri TaxID=7753 RepID=UPI002AB682F7|nr:growth arrest and DNA damage-inducible protein GADD45 beta-like [Lethenteron reissneri]
MNGSAPTHLSGGGSSSNGGGGVVRKRRMRFAFPRAKRNRVGGIPEPSMTVGRERAANDENICPIESMEHVGAVEQALEDLLLGSNRHGHLTVGVYEAAKLLNIDPDSVVLCLLAADADEESDLALQIHFTLIQAFCGDNDIDVIRVRGVERLAQLLAMSGGVGAGRVSAPSGVVGAAGCEGDDASCCTATTTTTSSYFSYAADEPRDLHCLLLTAPLPAAPLRTVAAFCADSRHNNQWVPCLNLAER